MNFRPSFGSKFRVQQQEIMGRKTINLTIELDDLSFTPCSRLSLSDFHPGRPILEFAADFL